MSLFRFRTAARRWVPAVATLFVVAGVLPTVALAADPGTIVVIQDTQPDDPQDFRYNVAGSEFLLDDDPLSPTESQRTISNVAPGFQAVAQEPVSGFDLHVSCSDPDGGTYTTQTGAMADVDPGETITCTLTNASRGNVVIRLDTTPDAPPAVAFKADWGDFTLNDDGSDADGLWPELTAEGLLPGTHHVTESYTPGLAYVGIVCIDPDDGTVVGDFGDVTLDVDAGETIDCTFTNAPAALPPSADLHITLDMAPDDPADVSFAFVGHDWPFSLDDDPTDGTLANVADLLDRDPGTFTIAARLPGGWQVKSLSCVDPDKGSSTDSAKAQVTVDLDDGEDVSCTFTLEPVPTSPPPTATCNGKAATIVGKPGATIRGTQGPDVIVSLAGSVRIDGRGGNDTICTGPGDDIVNGGAGDDWIDAGDGTNTVDGGAGADVIRAGSGNDVLLGDTGNDRVFGGEGDNLVSTGGGNDAIVTGAGNDRIDGGKDFDTCQPGAGVNAVNRCEA